MKSCYIFAAAEGLPDKFNRTKEDTVIAADAGLIHLNKLGITPDIALGDFDSLGFVPDCGEIIKHPVKKDDTDTLLAVKTGFERGYKRFILYGCTGGRLDHTVANIQVLSYIACNGGIGFICGDGFCITAIKNGRLDFTAGAKGNISVFSASHKADGVYEKGLLYELDNARLCFDLPLGVSNEFTGRNSYVSVKSGVLTVIWDGTLNDLK